MKNTPPVAPRPCLVCGEPLPRSHHHRRKTCGQLRCEQRLRKMASYRSYTLKRWTQETSLKGKALLLRLEALQGRCERCARPLGVGLLGMPNLWFWRLPGTKKGDPGIALVCRPCLTLLRRITRACGPLGRARIEDLLASLVTLQQSLRAHVSPVDDFEGDMRGSGRAADPIPVEAPSFTRGGADAGAPADELPPATP